MSLKHRGSHYWLWFLLFGVIPLIQVLRSSKGLGANADSYEVYWLVGAGLLGLVFGLRALNDGNLARPYDVIIGLIFTVAGVIGIVGYFGDVGSIGTFVSNVGFMLGGLYPLVHTFLGIKSLHHGISPEK